MSTVATVGLPGSLGGAGFFPENRFAQAVLDTSLTCVAGDVMMLKETAVDATHGFVSTILVPTAAGLISGKFCICMETQTTAAGPVKVLVQGSAPALLTAITPAIGAAMSASNAARGLKAALTTEKVIATMLEVGVASTTKRVWFDGINGFGNLA